MALVDDIYVDIEDGLATLSLVAVYPSAHSPTRARIGEGRAHFAGINVLHFTLLLLAAN